MQVKKFEAPTIQEALEVIKRELGPEAIILQTKQNKRGFGLMSKASVEVTAAVSERSLQKKTIVERKLPEPERAKVRGMAAERQAEIYDKYVDRKSDRATAERQAERAAVATRQAEREAASQADARRAQAQSQLQQREQLTRARAHADAREQAREQARAPRETRYADIMDEGEDHPASTTRRADGGGQPAQSRPATRDSQARGLAQPGLMEPMDLGSGPQPRTAVEQELSQLKRMLEEMKSSQDAESAIATDAAGRRIAGGEALATPALNDAFDQLTVNGVERRFALSLARKVSFELGPQASQDPDSVIDQLAHELMQSVAIRSPLEDVVSRDRRPAGATGPTVIALIGPTGVGKTTTVAKMASEALLKRGCKVGLVNLDSYRIGAFDQLGTYAKILNVPFRSCATGDELKAAMKDFQGLDLVIIDTTGRSQKDPEALAEMKAILGQIPSLRTQLVLSVTTRDNELYDMASRFSMFDPEGMTLSKLDEGTIYGAAYNLAQKAKLPLLYFTTGQRVPEDIEEATGERVAALILGL